ncbi:uncharacterized protein MYCGRDRAFT_106703 [Zymoseptoria tritici IPO323]|uniref:Uncharacterized protein n=1 Tax=Zymoseptoria tritici (strain CBS 115943 / IPO323) TaxID=336722 RepID=F9XS54_ZYMTI|nr:uncharacterized protein MYCGRDRAFT_106703 [Zymoseptoria tritici IPO323]EGP81936.1 hypothetical protein MYCGRDRAFT_106703 [Zymoseptoria tritici IPO323]
MQSSKLTSFPSFCFGVFSLAFSLHNLFSGLRAMRLWYFDRPLDCAWRRVHVGELGMRIARRR